MRRPTAKTIRKRMGRSCEPDRWLLVVLYPEHSDPYAFDRNAERAASWWAKAHASRVLPGAGLVAVFFVKAWHKRPLARRIAATWELLGALRILRGNPLAWWDWSLELEEGWRRGTRS